MKKIFARIKEKIAAHCRPKELNLFDLPFSTLEHYEPMTEEETQKLLDYIESVTHSKKN